MIVVEKKPSKLVALVSPGATKYRPGYLSRNGLLLEKNQPLTISLLLSGVTRALEDPGHFPLLSLEGP